MNIGKNSDVTMVITIIMLSMAGAASKKTNIRQSSNDHLRKDFGHFVQYLPHSEFTTAKYLNEQDYVISDRSVFFLNQFRKQKADLLSHILHPIHFDL